MMPMAQTLWLFIFCNWTWNSGVISHKDFLKGVE